MITLQYLRDLLEKLDQNHTTRLAGLRAEFDRRQQEAMRERDACGWFAANPEWLEVQTQSEETDYRERRAFLEGRIAAVEGAA